MLSKNENLPVLFISSALIPDARRGSEVFEYFETIITYLSILLSKCGFDLILKIPQSQEQAVEDQKTFLNELIGVRLDKFWSGIIIAPFDKDKIVRPLGELLLNNKKFPILTIDKGYFSAKEIQTEVDTSIQPPSYVMCDEELGGKMAAQSLINYFNRNEHEVKKPSVVIVWGIMEPSKPRVEGFENEIIKQLGEGVLYKDPLHCDFKRVIAKQKATNFLQEHKLIPKAFFCCNDEMALGVRDALEEEKERLDTIIGEIKKSEFVKEKEQEAELHPYMEELLWIQNIKVLGFDSIPEVKILLRNKKEPWLLNTVDVEIYQQVKELVMLFNALKKGEELPEKKKYIKHPPALEVEISEQNNHYNR